MAVSKKFRWTNKNGESVEVDIGADGANIDVDGKSLPEILEEIKNTSGNIITESNDINTEPSAIHLSKIPIEGMYYLIPPQGGGADNTWDSISWDNGSAYFSDGNINGEEAAIIRYCGGVGENAFEIIAKFNIHDHENKDVLDGITADRISDWNKAYTTAVTIAEGIGSLSVYTDSGTLEGVHWFSPVGTKFTAQVDSCICLGVITSKISDGNGKVQLYRLGEDGGIYTASCNTADFDAAASLDWVPIEHTTYSSDKPVRIGTWIDGTPIWRWTFKETVDEIDLHDQEKTIMPPLNNTMNYFVVNTFAQTYYSSPNIVDDKVATYTDTGIYKMSSTFNVDGIYGWVEFVTPESNIK